MRTSAGMNAVLDVAAQRQARRSLAAPRLQVTSTDLTLHRLLRIARRARRKRSGSLSMFCATTPRRLPIRLRSTFDAVRSPFAVFARHHDACFGGWHRPSSFRRTHLPCQLDAGEPWSARFFSRCLGPRIPPPAGLHSSLWASEDAVRSLVGRSGNAITLTPRASTSAIARPATSSQFFARYGPVTSLRGVTGRDAAALDQILTELYENG